MAKDSIKSRLSEFLNIVSEVKQTTRCVWVDYAKVISICLVISYHVPPRNASFIADVVSMLRMPAFFLIAGYLFRIEKFTSLSHFVRHRSTQLLIPYMSFFVLFYILWLLVGRTVVGGDELSIPVWKPLMEFLLGSPSVIVAPYWFICCLYVTQLVYYILAKNISRKYLIAICLLMPYLNCLWNLTSLPWQVSSMVKYLSFYAFANIFKDQISNLGKTDWFNCVLFFFIALLCVYGRSISDNEWLRSTLYTLGGLLMLPLYVWFCKLLPEVSSLMVFSRFIGQNSIVILAIQNYIIGVLILVAKKFYDWPVLCNVTLSNIMVTISVLVLSVIPVVLINRYASFMIGRKN